MKLSKMLTPPVKASFISFSLASAMIVSAFSASAEDYVRLTVNKNNTTKFEDASWSEKVENPSTRDYLVADKKEFKPCTGEIVTARSLTFGELGGSVGNYYIYYTTKFENNGVIFANGECYTRASDVTVNGLATFVSPSAAPFRFHDDGYRPRGITFGGKATAAADVHILAYANKTNDFYLAFNDASAFEGTLTITSNYTSAGAPYRAYLKLDCPSFPGKVILKDGTWIANTVDCEVGQLSMGRGSEIRPGATLLVDEFVLDEDAELNFKIDATAGSTSPFITVKDVFSFGGEGRIKLNLTGTVQRAEALAADAQPVIVPLLSLPADCEYGPEDFELPTYALNARNPVLKWFEDAQSKTLAACYYPLVKSTTRISQGGNYSINKGECKLSDSVNTAVWADGLAAHENAYYRQIKVTGTTAFITPFDFENVCRFPGEGIIFDDASGFALQGVEFDVKRIAIWVDIDLGGLYDPAKVQTLKFDEMTIADNKTLTLNLRGASTVILKGPISGGETATINVAGASGSTSSCETFNLLDGDNRNFTGKIKVHSEANRATEDGRGVTTLYVKDGKNLGGARSEFTYDALSINNKGFLKVIDSATLDEPTRGIYLDSSATLTDPKAGVNCVRFSVTNETGALTIKETITLNGTIRKTGAGALALGGSLKFLDGDGALTDDVPARADLHGLIMTGGQLKPLAARSMDGLDIVFSNKVSKLAVGLTIDAATTDAELAQYGFIDLKTENNPIVAVTQSGTIPVTFENLPTTDSNEAFTVPICTVRKSAAADVLSVLELSVQRIIIDQAKYKVALCASEPFALDGEQAVTIKADVTPPAGLMLLVR